MAIPTCNVLCCVNDDAGLPVVGASVSAKLNRADVYNGFIIPQLVEGFTNEAGQVTLALWPNQLGSTESVYAVKIISPDGKRISVNAVVPNQQTAQLHLISEVPPYEGKTDGQLILTEAVAASSAAISSAASALASQTAAAESEINAADSANSALASKDAAATSATNAANSATSALLSKDASATSASQAATSASSAQTSAATASDKATQASVYASTASARASESATSATTATTQANMASNSASQAATSATNAATSASNSSTSAAAAQSSAVQAATSASNAAAEVAAAISAHKQDTDPHPQYTTTAEAAAAAPVQSVAGKTGTVTLEKGDVGLGNVDNTSDANKPISTATQAALNTKLNTSQATAAGLALLGAADVAAQRSALGLANHQLVSVDEGGNVTIPFQHAVLVATTGLSINSGYGFFSRFGMETNSVGVPTTVIDYEDGGVSFRWQNAERLNLNPQGRLLLNTTDDGSNMLQVGGSLNVTDKATTRSNLGLANHEKVTVDASGNLLLGSGVAAGKLTVMGSNSVGFNAGVTGSPQSGNLFYVSDGSGWCFDIGKYQNNAFTPQIRFTDTGRVLLGTTTNDGVNLFQCAGNGRFDGTLTVARGDVGHIGTFKVGSDAGYGIRFCNASWEDVGSIILLANSTAFNTSSDRRLKANILPANDSGTLLDSVQIVSHDWKAGGHARYGVIAQDLHAVFPEAVTVGDDGEAIKQMWAVDYSKLVAPLLLEVQSLRRRVAVLEAV